MGLSDRSTLALAKFERALAALREVMDANETAMARDALLLRYVFTFEMAWQAMNAILRDLGEDPPRVASEVLKTAFVTRLIEDPDLWRALREARNEVSHAYDEKRAIAIAALVRAKALPAFDRLADVLRAHS